MPLTVVHDIDPAAVTFIALCYAMFLIGAGVATPIRVARVRAMFKSGNPGRQRLLLALAGTASILLTGWDRFITRGVSLSGGWMERREALLQTSSTSAAVLGAILLPAIYLYLFTVFRDRAAGETKLRLQVVFAMSLCAAHPIIGLLLGSRSGLLTSLVYLVVFPLFFRQRPINWLLVMKVCLISFGTVLLFSAVFLDRLDTMNMSVSYSAVYSTYAFTVRPSDWALEALDTADSSFLSLIFFTLVNLAQYYVHGLLEAMYQVSNEDQIIHSLGAFLFFIPYKFVSLMIPLPDVFDVIALSKTSIGSYTSFFGPIHSDFGWFALVIMFVFGVWSTRTFNLSKIYSSHVPLSILLSITIFLFPVVNFLLLGVNFYVLIGFLMFSLWGRWVVSR